MLNSKSCSGYIRKEVIDTGTVSFEILVQESVHVFLSVPKVKIVGL